MQKECLPSLALLYVCLPICLSVCPLKTDTVPALPPSRIPFCSPMPSCRETGFLHSLSFLRCPSLLFPGPFSHWDDSQPSGATADNQPPLLNDSVSEPQASWLEELPLLSALLKQGSRDSLSKLRWHLVTGWNVQVSHLWETVSLWISRSRGVELSLGCVSGCSLEPGETRQVPHVSLAQEVSLAIMNRS